jgi:dienelactone hydrolase
MIMPIITQPLNHDGPGGVFEATWVADDTAIGARAGILLLPNVLGIKPADVVKERAVAALGYRVLVADIYGQGNRPSRTDADPARFMNALNADRALLRDRLARSLTVLAGQPGVDSARVAAIGFCFGGKCVLDMARAGMSIRSGVSFHGVYDRPEWPSVEQITAKLLVCHGWDDPIAPPEATVALAAELTNAQADWQLHAYGRTGHAFTDESADGSRPGIAYQADADRRSWEAMVGFLAETLR